MARALTAAAASMTWQSGAVEQGAADWRRRRTPSTPEYTSSGLIRPPGHQREDIPLGVLEVGEPERPVPRVVDRVGRLAKADPAVGEGAVGFENVLYVEIEDGRRVVEFRVFRPAQHQPHAAGLEERQARRLEQKGEAQGVAVEGGGPGKILDDDGDLADVAEDGAGHGDSREKVDPVIFS